MPSTLELAHHGVVSMAKKTSDRPSDGRQINFRAGPDLFRRLDAVADGLGLDVSNLVRMILHENLHRYESRLDEIRQQQHD